VNADQRKIRRALRELKDFRLNLKSLAALKDRMAHVTARLKPCPYWYKPGKLLTYPPARRSRMLDEWYRARYSKVAKSWPSPIIRRLGPFRRPVGVVSQIKAKDFEKVLRTRELEFIEIEKIQGIRKQRKRKQQRELEWYAVQARYAIQVEGHKSGMQGYEDRILLVKASGFADAEKRLKKEAYGAEYLNTRGEFVRWHFEKVLDIYNLFEDEINPKGTEVFSQIKYRRMKPEYEWHPSKDNRRRSKRR